MDRPTVYKYPLLQNSKSAQKMAVQPLIFPRLADREIWSFPSYRHSAVNTNNMGYDLSEDYGNIPQVDDYSEYDPRVATYTNFSLDRLGQVCDSGDYTPGKQYSPNGQQIDDIRSNSTRSNSTRSNSSRSSHQGIDTSQVKKIQQPSYPSVDNYPEIKNPGNFNNIGMPQTVKPTDLSYLRQPPSERFAFPSVPAPVVSSTSPTSQIPFSNSGTPIAQVQDYPAPQIRPRFPEDNYPLSSFPQYAGQAEFNRDMRSDVGQLNPNYTPISVVTPTGEFFSKDAEWPIVANAPPSNLLIPRTIDSVYGPGAVTNEERIKYMENIQPNEFSYSDVAYPINANLGISYNPDFPPLVPDQIATPYGTTPLFHRIDPQLIRDQNIPPWRYAEMPRRTKWSARYGNFDAAPGTVGFEDIYDPRFNGYGDEYRAYGDIASGQIQYYYSDLDIYRYPSWVTRSKVDFIDYVDPMGRVLPEYSRQVGVDDVKATVGQQYDADALYFREDLMERLMRKNNEQSWQARAAPLRKNANVSTFTSNY